MKILVDMNLSPLWIPFLATHDFAAVHWSAIGDPAAEDSEILGYAAANSFVIFTHDLDFGALLAASGVSRPSVIQVRTQDVMPVSIGNAVVRAIQAAIRQLDEGALVTVEPDRARIRILPI
jgi:predicted nuclease of predicted toxin-antitoxin system